MGPALPPSPLSLGPFCCSEDSLRCCERSHRSWRARILPMSERYASSRLLAPRSWPIQLVLPWTSSLRPGRQQPHRPLGPTNIAVGVHHSAVARVGSPCRQCRTRGNNPRPCFEYLQGRWSQNVTVSPCGCVLKATCQTQQLKFGHRTH